MTGEAPAPVTVAADAAGGYHGVMSAMRHAAATPDFHSSHATRRTTPCH